MPCDTGYSMVDDQAGSHWFYMGCGIVRVGNEELPQWWNTRHTYEAEAV